jgi:hypothetical protein
MAVAVAGQKAKVFDHGLRRRGIDLAGSLPDDAIE